MTAFEPLLNDEQTAQLLGGMHPKTLQRMARYGQIPSHKIGRFWYFRASELDAWLKSSCVSADVAVGSGNSGTRIPEILARSAVTSKASSEFK